MHLRRTVRDGVAQVRHPLTLFALVQQSNESSTAGPGKFARMDLLSESRRLSAISTHYDAQNAAGTFSA